MKNALDRSLRSSARPTAPKGVEVFPPRAHTERQLEELKDRLLAPVLKDPANRQDARLLSHAAEEAAALAGLTAFPLLVLPVLLEEKLSEANCRARRQAQIRERTSAFMGLPAG